MHINLPIMPVCWRAPDLRQRDAVDLAEQRIEIEDRTLRYDLLSINSGHSQIELLRGSQHAIAVKPIPFIKKLLNILAMTLR